MRAMRIEGAGSTFLVAEHDNLFAQKFFFPRKVAQFVGSAHGLPVAPHQLAHSTVWLDTGQLVIRHRALPSVGRSHRLPPLSPGPAVS